MKKQAKPQQNIDAPAPVALQEAPAPAQAPIKERGDAEFPIIGIGASAGGLEALELFMKNVPEGSGMAFVVIQHLAPTQKGVLPELLQRATSMPVAQITDGMKIERDHVYVIPPNKDISLLNGMLYLFQPEAPRGLRLPVDFFFRSLAADREASSVGVILSGMGSDGMLGLRDIKEKAGGAFVQDPSSAKFDGMPNSAINAGLADIVARVEELPGKIVAYFQHGRRLATPNEDLAPTAKSALQKVFILLRSITGHDFSLYKKSTVNRRIERRMGLHQISSFSVYVRFLQANPQEAELLFKELLIGVTSFFREPAAWESLKNEAFPALLRAHPTGGVLRAWVAGCSTGEEAYSLSIVFKEALEKLAPSESFSLQIFASDLDKDAIDKARAGVYPPNIVADVAPERLRRFFVQHELGYSICKEIRDTVVFAPHSVCKDPPFTKLDILICRNLLIYLEQELQKKLLPLFHYSLNPGGILFLGSAETIGGFNELFDPLDSKNRLYRRRYSSSRTEPVEFLSSVAFALPKQGALQQEHDSPVNLQALADKLILQKYAPAAVVTSSTGDILYISGRTGKYLEPAAGKACLNIFAMAREGLRLGLSNTFRQALQQQKIVQLPGLKVGTNGGAQLVALTVQPIAKPSPLAGMMLVVFADQAAPRKEKRGRAKVSAITSSEVEALQLELRLAREETQTTFEEMQSSQEELKSTNEEVQSTNEELQSTNEELTTSKEEMQSMNEELQTVNSELQAKLAELSRASNDMKNLLNSTDIATLFLDDMLHVRRFTSKVSTIVKLLPHDVGRPFTDISSDLYYPTMTADAQEVLRTLVPVEKPVAASDGRWFLVRIMPYRTLENRIDGVVLTFVDISVAKRLEAKLREGEGEIRSLFKNMPNPFALLQYLFSNQDRSVDCRVMYVNDAYEQILGVSNEALLEKSANDVWPGIAPRARQAYAQVATTGGVVRFELDHEPSGKRYRCNVYRQDAQTEAQTGRLCVLFEEISPSLPTPGANEDQSMK